MEEFVIIYDEGKEMLAESLKKLMRVRAIPLKYTTNERGMPKIQVDVGYAKKFIYMGGFIPPYAESFLKTLLAISKLSELGSIEVALLSPMPYHKGSRPDEMAGFAAVAKSLYNARRFVTFDLLPAKKLKYFNSQAISLSAFPILADYVAQRWGNVSVVPIDEELAIIAEALTLKVGGGKKKLVIDVETLRIPETGGDLFFTTHLLDTVAFTSFEEVITTNLLKPQPNTKVLDVAPVLADYIRSL